MRDSRKGIGFARIVGCVGSRAAALVAVGLVVFRAGPALSQEAGAVSLELNRLEQVERSCQAYLVVGNETKVDFESLGLDLVMFDPEGIVSRRLAVEIAPLPAGKTSVRVFSLDGTACDKIGRVLLNSVVSCEDGRSRSRGCRPSRSRPKPCRRDPFPSSRPRSSRSMPVRNRPRRSKPSPNS